MSLGNPIGTSSNGKPVYIYINPDTNQEENVSEKSTTFKLPNGKWVNVPTIHNGKIYTNIQIQDMYRDKKVTHTSIHNSQPEADKAADERSNNTKIILNQKPKPYEKALEIGNNLPWDTYDDARKQELINIFKQQYPGKNLPSNWNVKIPAGDIIEDVEQVASIKTEDGLLDSTSGLFDLPEFVKDLKGPQLKANATEEEKNDYILNVVMGSINPGSKLGVVGDKSFKNLHKIVSKMFNKADDAKTTAIAYEGFRRKGNLIGANVDNMEDFTSIIKNPKKVLNENQVRDYLELAGIASERPNLSAGGTMQGIFNVELIKTSINKSGKLVVKITTENPLTGTGYSLSKKEKVKKIITITEPTLQKLIDKGFKLGNF